MDLNEFQAVLISRLSVLRICRKLGNIKKEDKFKN